MHQHWSVGIAAAFGLTAAAQAQDSITFHWTWVHTHAWTTLLKNDPADPLRVSPGEGVEFRADMTWSPPFGTIRTSQVTGITGPVEGFAKVVIDFEGSGNANGMFHNVVRIPPISQPNPGWTANYLPGIQMGQFGLPGSTINTSNPVVNILRIRWTPNDYTPRIVTFTPSGSTITPIFGELYINFGGPQGSGEEIYTTYQIDNAYFFAGAPMAIQVIPGPGGAVLLGLGGLMCARRRRPVSSSAIRRRGERTCVNT
jgi:hypothetical protein